MRLVAISCVAVLCLAPHRPDLEQRRERNADDQVYLTYDGDGPRASFVGGGVMKDSCGGKVKFKSQLNHIGETRYDLGSLDEISYKVTFADGETEVFRGRWYWQATPSFMADFRVEHRINLNDPHEDMALGDEGSEDRWQEECEYRATDISQCDRIFWPMRFWGSDPTYKPRIKLTGDGDPLNPAYYKITFKRKTADGCKQKWKDRLVFQFHENQPD